MTTVQSPRFGHWVTFFISSVISLGALLEAVSPEFSSRPAALLEPVAPEVRARRIALTFLLLLVPASAHGEIFARGPVEPEVCSLGLRRGISAVDDSRRTAHQACHLKRRHRHEGGGFRDPRPPRAVERGRCNRERYEARARHGPLGRDFEWQPVLFLMDRVRLRSVPFGQLSSVDLWP